MLEQKSRTSQDRDPDRDHRPPSRSELDQLASEARSPSTRYAAPVMFVAGVLIAVATGVLVAQNRESTTVEWLSWDPTGPVWAVLALTFIAGLATGPLLLGAVSLMRHRRHEREDRIDELTRRSRRT